jgi:BNR repeat-like domain
MRCSKIGVLFAGIFLLAQFGWAPFALNPRITWTPGDSECPNIACDSSDNLHVVWFDNTPGNYEIYYKKSTDGGIKWSTSRRLTWTLGDSWTPAIALDDAGNPYVVWYDYTAGNSEIYFKKSSDGGATWTTSKRLTYNAGWSFCPGIAVDSSGRLHVVWYDNTTGNYEIYYRKSTDGGTSWTMSRQLTNNAGLSGSPRIAAYSSSSLHLVWSDSTPGVNEIYYKKSTDGGASWTAGKRLTWTSGWSYAPDIAVDSSGNPHIVWYDDTPGNDEIYYKKSANGGATWSSDRRLTWNSGKSRNPSIAIGSPDEIHVVWDDNTPGNYEIYYKGSFDGGAKWTASYRETWNSGASASPRTVFDSLGLLHVVWYDYTPGNYEIYHVAWAIVIPMVSGFGVR